ncbi:MBL fold metallo-hydrolase [Pseudoxanthomonas broegbernensis]|uniref:MBL fold metallo-hydrolase n=1 Tax=Pseudoxanthomonas broegbernensis TaxID=83619 RepID=UPI00182B17EA|nr:MBL fold metallo-hydrolase [Pseudoxanthomonas broegbernensis]MBB6063547.1 glyoxylase-like metal-dependent hydrolase (beta-lactamase superfamily II) [Pseudoxanthomonas broegbernensis]
MHRPSRASDAAHAHGIHTIDTGHVRPRFDAAYLVVEDGRAAFVDCGTRHSVAAMLAALEAAGLAARDVDWLILTHAHLDHAGGAGALMRHLPAARLVAHPRAAPHMIDPSRLVAGATAVYGAEEFARHYGQVLPVPAERVVVAGDGHVVDLAGRALRCIDTPGHARDHLCVWDARSAAWFTGDAFGLSYREMDGARGAFILPTSSPVQFEPEAMQASIQRMLAESPQAMYLTHYGRVAGVARLAAELHEQIDAMVSLAQACDGGADRHRALVAALSGYYLERAQAHGCPLDDAGVLRLLEVDIQLNAQGLEIWLDRARRP